MSTHEHSILLIEDNPVDARLVVEAVTPSSPPAAGAPRFRIQHVERLADASPRLDRCDVDLVLLDLTLPDSDGIETLRQLRVEARAVPVVVLTDADDERLGIEALQAGAQDYLVKGRLDYELLRRALRYALERHRLQAALEQASHVDELTGLYNRRGFLAHAERAVHLAQRKRRGMLLAFVDVDDLKRINDGHGHADGDRAIVATARIIGSAFRVSDIIARLGGDEFVALLIEADSNAALTVRERLQHRLDEYNAHRGHEWPLSLSVGIAGTSGDVMPTLEEMMAEADQALYAEKRAKRALP